MASVQQPSLGTWAVLALLREGDTHGWALVRAMAPQAEIGRVWSIRPALVYRSVVLAIDAGLVSRAGVEQGARGSPRTLLRVTSGGLRAVEQWLADPVVHVRDLRSALLLKLLFAQRSQLDRVPLLKAQRVVLEDAIAVMEGQPTGTDAGEVMLRRFRLETTRAGLRFVEGELARPADYS